MLKMRPAWRARWRPWQTRGPRAHRPREHPPSKATEKLDPEGGGGFNPRIRPAKTARALAPEGRFPPISPEITSFSSACPSVSCLRLAGLFRFLDQLL